MNFDDLRRAIEASAYHSRLCTQDRESRKVICHEICPRHAVLAALATLEREHAERERRLREDVLQWLDSGFSYADTFPESETIRVYDDQDVNFAHRKLAEILDSPTAPQSGKEEIRQEQSRFDVN